LWVYWDTRISAKDFIFWAPKGSCQILFESCIHATGSVHSATTDATNILWKLDAIALPRQPYGNAVIAQCRGHLDSGCILYISTGISLQAIGAAV
jgi:hypothetical protein